MDYDFITTCNWTSTGTFTLQAFRGSSTNVASSFTLYYRKKGTSTWNSTTNGEINITSTGEWEVANDWNKSGNSVLTHSYYRISAINSCTNVYFNEDTLGSHCGSYFLNACWYMCYNMVSIPDGFKIPQCITTAGDYFLRDTWASCQKLEAMPEGFILPKDLTSIGFGFLKTTWYSCYALKSMPTGFNLPQGITTLGADFMGGTWMYCSNLTSMPKGFNLPVGATSVGYTQVMQQTWRYCTKLKNMPEGFNIPSGITSVGSVFFSKTWADCTSLETIPIGFSIPSGITSVGANFFTGCWNNCTNLKQDGYTEDLVFEFDTDDVFGGTCPIIPDSITGASKENPVRVPVNRPAPPPYRYWVGGSGNWNDTSHWSVSSGGSGGASVPTSDDDVFIDENSGFGSGGAITDAGGFCKNFTSNSGHTYTITTSGDYYMSLGVYGSLTLEGGMTIEKITFLLFGEGAGNQITTNGGVLFNVEILNGDGDDYPESIVGTYTLQDDLQTTGYFSQGNGTFDANDHNVTATGFTFFTSAGDPPTVIMGSGTWEATEGDGVWLEEEGGVITIIPETSTIKFSHKGTSIKRFVNRGTEKIFNDFIFTGRGGLTITGNNAFNNFTLSPDLDFVGFEESKTQTFSSFSLSGTSGKLVKIASTDDEGRGEGSPYHYSFAWGGAGYEVGDILTDGKSAFEVTGVGENGNVTDCNAIYIGFFYTPQENIPLTGGHGTGATFGVLEVFGPVEGKHTLSKSSGTVTCDYLNLTNSTATGGAMWYAGENSIDNGDNEGWIFAKGPMTERELYTQGRLFNISEKSLFIEGSPFVKETELYIIGFVRTSSDRNLYFEGYDIGFNERGLYARGTESSLLERDLYLKGSLDDFSERSLYLIGKSVKEERELYLSGLKTEVIDRSLYLKGVKEYFSSVALYVGGKLQKDSARKLYLSGWEVDGSEHGLWVGSYEVSAQEKELLLGGCDIGFQEKGLYLTGKVTDSSERKLYAAGGATFSTDYFNIYFEKTGESERELYTVGTITETLDRVLFIEGFELGYYDSGLYLEGYRHDFAVRDLYTIGCILDFSQRGLYLGGYEYGLLERGLYLEGITTGTSERKLYICGDGEVPYEEDYIIYMQLDRDTYIDIKTKKIYGRIK